MSDAPVTLVTGFPNFRASQLVSHLLSNGEGEVWSVVSERDEALAVRFRAALPDATAARFRHFVGDPAAMDMGLGGAEYRELARAVTCIQHVAQQTGPTFGKESFEELNVGSMREALELAGAAAHLRSLVVHSSVVVSGDREGYVGETELVAGQRFPGPGPATLARAELMARRRMDRLPIVVLRTGQVVGPSTTGAVDTLEGVYLLILLILNSPQDLSPLLPDWGDAPLHVVPADHFVRAAAASSRHRAALGQTLQLTDPHPMTVRKAFNRCLKVRERLAAEGLAFPPASAALRRDSVLRDSLQAILWRPRTFINMTFRKVQYGTDIAERMLGELGLSCPPLESYFDQLVRHVVRAVSAAPARAVSP
ncbi:MAG TPA: SDR family oxidoreductase [Polyangiaceae bacterium]|nr:SDR family oxidoreductase [Polyangiaceae bacterium]